MQSSVFLTISISLLVILSSPYASGGSSDSDIFNRLFGSDSSSSSSEEKPWWTLDHRLDKDNPPETESMSQTIVQIITGIVVVIIVLIFVTFVLCLCCPICILAKMRKRRRGVVIRVNQEGNGRRGQTQQQLFQTPPAPQHQMIAVSNNVLRSGPAPYPVQESVTIVPLVNSTSQMPQYTQANQQPMQYHPQHYDPPPPYPGLGIERAGHVQNGQVELNQPPYNPYYQDSEYNPSAPPTAK